MGGNLSEIKINSADKLNKDKKECTNVLNYISDQPWVATENAVNTVLSIAQRMTDPETVAAKLGRRLENTRTVSVRDGIAIIDVKGTIFRYANIFNDISGGTSLQTLSKDLNTALDNEDIKAILLDIDSPGGEANGMVEFGDMIFNARKIKPVFAFVGGSAASGAYWIAAAAGEIIISETAILGSIGTVVQIVDTTKRDEKAGVRVFDIVSRKSPNKRLDPTTDDGREQILNMLDSFTEVFINRVAKFRNVTTEKVEADFGRGGIFVGEENIENGLADSLGSFESLVSQLSDKFNTGEFTMNTEPKKPEAIEEDIPLTAETINALNPAIAEQFRKEGADAERARIKGVQEKLMIGHETLIESLKFDGETTPDQAAGKILEAEKTKGENAAKELEADASAVEKIESESDHPNAESKEDDAAVANMVKGSGTAKKS